MSYPGDDDVDGGGGGGGGGRWWYWRWQLWRSERSVIVAVRQ